MVFSSPDCLQSSANCLTTAMAWLLSGAGMMPSDREKLMPDSKTSVCMTERASSNPNWCRWDTMGAMP